MPAGRSFSGSLAQDELQRHVLRAYFIMRVGIATAGIACPFLLLFGGLLAGICPQNSMSAYYHAIGPSGASMRNWFVGVLFAVSISLGLYRGFSRVEDWLLDAAMVFGIGIAVFPMPWSPGGPCGSVGSASYRGAYFPGLHAPVHVVCAVLYFLCMALVCWFCADDTLSLEPDQGRRRTLKVTYRVIAVLMPGAMFAAWALNTIAGSTFAVFWAEAAGAIAFGVYWALKGFELNKTAADLKAASGRLRQNEGELEEVAPRPDRVTS